MPLDYTDAIAQARGTLHVRLLENTDAAISRANVDALVALARPSIRLIPPVAEATSPENSPPRRVEGLSDVSALAAGWNFTLALAGGTVWAWGRNDAGQLGDGTRLDKVDPVQIRDLEGVVAIAAGMSACLALRDDGSVMAWGSNHNGQLGDGTRTDRYSPVRVAGLDGGVVAIAAGNDHALAAMSDGSVVTWGPNLLWNYPAPGESAFLVPTPVSLDGIAVSLAAGRYSAALMDDGTVFFWGGRVRDDDHDEVTWPHRVPGLPGPTVAISCHGDLRCLQEDGSVWRYEGPQGYPYRSDPAMPMEHLRAGVEAISTGAYVSLALLGDGSVLSWGLHDEPPSPVDGLGPARAVSAGWDHGAAVSADGSVVTWGGSPLVAGDVAGTDETDIGSTKLGGVPDMPPGSSWPAMKGAPQAFLGQINLAELADFDVESLLPHSGLLSFFYDVDASVSGFDPDDRGGWHVAYTPASDALERLEFPSDLPSSGRFRPVPLVPGLELLLPSIGSLALDSVPLSEDEWYGYEEAISTHEHVHRVLGYPQPIQRTRMQLECQLASNGVYCGNPEGYESSRAQELRAGASDWELLLQLDASDEAGMEWGDCGRLYYWIRRQDLAAARFDQSWFVFQSH